MLRLFVPGTEQPRLKRGRSPIGTDGPGGGDPRSYHRRVYSSDYYAPFRTEQGLLKAIGRQAVKELKELCKAAKNLKLREAGTGTTIPRTFTRETARSALGP